MDYNLGDRKNCLIGNWNEEHSLHSYAGHYRTAPTAGMTHVRCIEHSIRYDSADLKSSHTKDFSDPKDPLNPLVYKPQACVGARQRLINAKLAGVQPDLHKDEDRPQRDWGTTHKSSYQVPADGEEFRTTKGGRRMRTQDNVPREYRDRTFLLEHNILAPHISLEGGAGGEAGSVEADRLADLQARDVPITVYSANVGKFEASNHGEGANPYGRHSAFSQPIEEYIRGGTFKDL
uniref:Uncharacterized protein n=1 Tax=Hemiselmis tepida TaxID=464990 RepID=A0A7S0WEI0_9CRYP|mmetsp:Transcript_7530/g.19300  ORF Transcript_7530/g.19300 Transcript_7530/m.19300 type:complete len:234 (+) Transcript_7530:88-789(+)|eukprot:CAMPEP_0174930234 /NCGR_PEP_ID=MMETSP1355-20121228/30866_1 /TAXON_ID=464990 /ORGANISM="Hemiselmis tepida, Strain CCMP443" /LENGTH=233 /DNA_ID=CAMNT_0016176515 /DNA_START=89 /DNA_END=790 /DNA_ORIENTATION=-